MARKKRKKGGELPTPTRIKIALMAKGQTMANIARELGVSRVFISRVIKGERKTPYVREAIAKAAGLKVEELWDD